MGYLRYSRLVGNLCQEICKEGSVYIKHRDEVEGSTEHREYIRLRSVIMER